MHKPIKPYSLKQAQELVNDAVTRSSARHDEWRLLEQLYACGSTDALLAGVDSPGAVGRAIMDTTGVPLDVVNLVLPHMNIIAASVISRDPKLLAEPLSGGEDAEAYAQVAQEVLKYFWQRTNATDDLRDATRDMVNIGNGFLKVGWAYEEVERKRSEDEQLGLLDAVLAEAVEFEAESGEAFSDDELADAVSPTTVDVEEDEPYVAYVSPYDVFVPQDARRIWEARWVAQRVLMPIDELRAQLDLSDDVVIATTGYRPTHTTRADVAMPFDSHITDGPFQYAEVYEFYDMRARRMMVFQVGGAEALFDGPLPYSHRYPPFVHLANYRRNPAEFWGFGDLKNIAGLQAMYNEILNEQMDNLRRTGNKVFISERLATPEVEEALLSAETNAAIKVPLPEGIPIQQEIMPMAAMPLPADVYNASGTVTDAMSQVLGLTDFQRGLNGADRMSGTAAAAVEGNSTLRAADKTAAVEKAASDVGKLMLLLCQEFMSEETAVRVVGTRGTVWVEVSPEDIAGEFRVRVEGGSMQSVNPAQRAQRALDRSNTIMPMLMNGGYDTEPLMRSILRDLGEDPDLILRKLPVEPAAEPAAGPMPAEMPAEMPAAPAAPVEDAAALEELALLENTAAALGLSPQAQLGDPLANQLDGGISL